jgi:hypothetical protein
MRELFNAVCALLLAVSPVSAQTIKGLQTARPVRQLDQANAALVQPSPKITPLLWQPNSVENALPPVAPDVSCPLNKILLAAQERVQELAENLQRFTATEIVDSAEIGKNGRRHRSLNYSYEYLATISQTRGGNLMIDESRKETGNNNPIQIPIQTMGLAIGAVVFHPRNLGRFKVVCEGLGQWNGKPAWQLYFEQLSENQRRFQSIYVNGKWFDVKLKGRAWIATESFQVEHMDFDSLEPIPRIRFVTERMGVDYCAVEFPKHNLKLWLPQSVDFYIDIGGHRYLNRHHFTNYLLFAVEIDQVLQFPRELK